MIKKLQKLKAKKGFTLVELIVVIAIIGVLAAILVPTMLGYVQSSRVTAADQVAKTIKDAAQVCATEMDTLGNGLTNTALVIGGTYTASSRSVSLVTDAGAATTAIGNDTNSTGNYKGMDPHGATAATKHANKLISSLTTLLTEAKDGSFVIVYTNGTCTQAYWSEDVAAATLVGNIDSTTHLITTSAWGTPGVLSAGGQIVGSNPKYNA